MFYFATTAGIGNSSRADTRNAGDNAMKKLISIILLCTLIVSLTSCGTLNFVDIEEFSSEVYAPNDITSAMEVVLEWFYGKTDMMLMNLSYVGDKELTDYGHYLEWHDADEVIVLATDYYVSALSDSPVLNTGFKYENYNFILVRTDGGEWEIVDQGY